MTEVENFKRLLRFDAGARIVSEIPEHVVSYRGSNHEDAGGVGHDRPIGESWNDFWGVGWHKDLDGVMGFPREHPLADLSRLDDFAFPDAEDPALYGQIFEMAAGQPPDTILSGSHRDTLWERAYMLVGMENLMAYFYTEPGYVRRLLARIMDFQLGIADKYVKAGCGLAHLGDDHGMQHTLLLGERVFYDFFMPEYARLFDFYKPHGCVIDFHSCGHIEPLVPAFAELGVDILNPVQAKANDLDRLREETARLGITLKGGMDSDVVMGGTPDDVRWLVRQRKMQLGREGGYICCPDQGLPFPKGNIEAFQQEMI